ncbi:MAG: toprim domain-containing protein [Chloroflexi bacterium]|nr:toprim domain-containing protein [Chloroflexota bacterium]
MTAETIAKALDGHQVGSGWIARCPTHDDCRPSLAVRDADGKTLVHCHAGCNQRGVIQALQQRGLWNGNGWRGRRHPIRRRIPHTRGRGQRNQPSTAARAIWQSTVPATGTPVEAYLAGRGLIGPIPPSIRFHRGIKHASGSFWPCMVARVTRFADEESLAIHRTFLARDGSGKAPVDPQRMMLGPCRGGAVHLGEPKGALLIGEGIETCLAAMQATGQPAWAALSTSGLRALELPDTVREVIVLVDGDDPGEAAADASALRWKAQGTRVRLARAPRGMDFNDLLLGHRPDSEERER